MRLGRPTGGRYIGIDLEVARRPKLQRLEDIMGMRESTSLVVEENVAVLDLTQRSTGYTA